MRLSESTKELPGRVGRVEQQELWLSRPQTFCQRGAADQWTYKLANQGWSFAPRKNEKVYKTAFEKNKNMKERYILRNEWPAINLSLVIN